MAKNDVSKISGEVVYENRWMKVREDIVQYPDGTKGIYGVVDKEDFALIIPRHENGDFQLVQQYRYPVGARYWEFPQGSCETQPGTDPYEVAKGELEEETGFTSNSLKKLAHLFEAYGFSSQGFHIFLADQLVLGRKKRDHEEQGMITHRFSLEEINEMIRSGQIKDAPTIAALGILSFSK